MEILIIMSIVCAIIGGAIDGGRGAILGGLLGIFGLLLAAILKGK
jgi:hypothetical protein